VSAYFSIRNKVLVGKLFILHHFLASFKELKILFISLNESGVKIKNTNNASESCGSQIRQVKTQLASILNIKL